MEQKVGKFKQLKLGFGFLLGKEVLTMKFLHLKEKHRSGLSNPSE